MGFLTQTRNDEAIAQADVFEVEFMVWLEEYGGRVVDVGPVLIISHGCECEKVWKHGQTHRPLLVAPLVLLGDLPNGQGELASRRKIARYWPVGVDDPNNPLGAEFAADMCQIQPVVGSDLLDPQRRIASMDDDSQNALAGWLVEFLTNRELWTHGGAAE